MSLSAFVFSSYDSFIANAVEDFTVSDKWPFSELLLNLLAGLEGEFPRNKENLDMMKWMKFAETVAIFGYILPYERFSS